MARVSERRLRDDALAIWKAGVAAVDAGALVRASLDVTDGDLLAVHDAAGGTVVTLRLSAIGRIAVVGAGKATTSMARAVEETLSDRIAAGWVNVPDATVEPLRRIHVHGARKLPDNRPTAEGVAGSREILRIAQSLGEDDLLVVLISGGGSALLPLPADGVSLEDKLLVTKLLQERGATIGEMNCVRKHLSRIKGGRLAEATKARVMTFIVSDVIGDPLDVIASGPTAPDRSTFEDAWDVLLAHGLLAAAPRSVIAHFEKGREGRVPETPKALDPRVENVIIGNNRTARNAAMWTARVRGYEVIDLGVVEGATQAAAQSAAAEISKTSRRVCLVSGGETTVDVAGATGKGGRNQEFALAVLDALGPEGLAGICLLCGGTDGEDGPTDAAGAFVDEELARAAVAKGLDPADFLRRHDAYHFFEPLGGLVKTGPTGTNVMDLRVVLIDRGAGARVAAAEVPEAKRASISLDP
jgi:glycerate 2-kinase